MLLISQTLMHGKRITDIVYQIINHWLSFSLSEQFFATNTQTTALNISVALRKSKLTFIYCILLSSFFQFFFTFHYSPLISGCPLEGAVGTVDLWPLVDLACLEDSGSEVLLFLTMQNYLGTTVTVDGIYLTLPEFKYHAWCLMKQTDLDRYFKCLCAFSLCVWCF